MRTDAKENGGGVPKGMALSADSVMLTVVVTGVVVAPWPLGSRLPWAAMLLASIAITSSALWLAHKIVTGGFVRATPAHWATLPFLVWIGIQWLAGWTRYPHGTAYDAVLYTSYAAVFLVSAILARTPAAARRMFSAVTAVTLAVGVFGLIQFLTWNGDLFWVWDPPYTGQRFGPFNNRNYFAGYMAVGLTATVAALVNRSFRRGYWPLVFLTWLSALSLLVSRSRGGTIAFAIASISVLGIATAWGPLEGGRKGRTPSRRFGRLIVAGGVALLAGLLWLNQADRVLSRLETLVGFEGTDAFVPRLTIWSESLPMLLERPWTGHGLGAFVFLFPSYRTSTTSLVETNAHNEYLEMAIETGLIGAAMCALFLVLLFRTGFMNLRRDRHPETFGIRLGALGAWLAICVYALSDFPTVIPAIDYTLAVLAGLIVADIGAVDEAARHP